MCHCRIRGSSSQCDDGFQRTPCTSITCVLAAVAIATGEQSTPMKEPISEPPAESAGLIDLGVVLGQNQAFAIVAGRCSAAQAAGLQRLREQRLYKTCTPHWAEF